MGEEWTEETAAASNDKVKRGRAWGRGPPLKKTARAWGRTAPAKKPTRKRKTMPAGEPPLSAAAAHQIYEVKRALVRVAEAAADVAWDAYLEIAARERAEGKG